MKARKVDTVVKNGKIVTSSEIIEAGIAIDDGKVVAVAKPTSLPKASKTIDADGNFILPGIIDVHSHVYDPGYLYREDFSTGSSAAAAGGVTTVIDMPLRKTVLAELVKEKTKIGQRDSLIDFSFHSGMMLEQNLDEIPEVARLGVKSFKVFMCAPFKAEEETLIQTMKIVSALDGVLVVHAEDDDLVTERTSKLIRVRKDPMAYLASRPALAEIKAIEKLVQLANKIDTHIHIAHMTTSQGVELLRKAKANGKNITGETCPQYLLFGRKDAERLGPFLKVTPPIRSRRDALSLWNALKAGVVDIVATDHAPATRSEKERGWKNIWDAPSGIPGLETLLPLMISEGVNRGLISLNNLCRMLCENPARIFHLHPRKGALQIKSDADIVIVDLKKESVITAEKLHYKVGWTPFEGTRLKGCPILTMVRGETIARDGQVIGRRGYGKFVPMS